MKGDPIRVPFSLLHSRSAPPTIEPQLAADGGSHSGGFALPGFASPAGIGTQLSKAVQASDLVVIAAPVNRTAKPKQRTVFRNLVRAEKDRTVPIGVPGPAFACRVVLGVC